MLRKIALILIALFIVSALYLFSNRAANLELQVEDGQVNLATSIPGDWDGLCVLAPYSTNSMAEETLGEAFNVELRSNIASSDSIALVVTMKDDSVTDAFEVSRNNVDFAHFGGRCFDREESQFSVPADGHPSAIED